VGNTSIAYGEVVSVSNGGEKLGVFHGVSQTHQLKTMLSTLSLAKDDDTKLPRLV